MITVVTGLPRSGTSLMMRMLHVGGLEMAADNFASYEIESFWEASPSTIAAYSEGKAVKWLEPLIKPLPKCHSYQFIWMRRDYTEQAKSHLRMMKAIGVDVLHDNHSLLAESLENDTAESLKLLQEIGELKVIEFRALKEAPLQTMRELSGFLGKKLLCLSAAQEVRRKKNENDFLELEFVHKRIEEQEHAISRGFETFQMWQVWQ